MTVHQVSLFCDTETVIGQLTVNDRNQNDITAQDYYAATNTRIAAASHFWQEISIDRCTDNLIEIDLRQIIQEKLPKVWQWCDITTTARCVPKEILTSINGISAWFTAKETNCQDAKISKHSNRPTDVFFNWFTCKGFIKINAADTCCFENRLHELVWDFRLKDGAGAVIAKAKGALYVEASVGGISDENEPLCELIATFGFSQSTKTYSIAVSNLNLGDSVTTYQWRVLNGTVTRELHSGSLSMFTPSVEPYTRIEVEVSTLHGCKNVRFQTVRHPLDLSPNPSGMVWSEGEW